MTMGAVAMGEAGPGGQCPTHPNTSRVMTLGESAQPLAAHIDAEPEAQPPGSTADRHRERVFIGEAQAIACVHFAAVRT